MGEGSGLAAAQPGALLSDVVEHLPMGVVVLDRAGRVSLYNRAEERLAGRDRARVIGRPFFDEVAPCLGAARLGHYYLENIGKTRIDLRIELAFPVPFVETPREVVLRLFSLDSGGEPFGVIVIEDVSLQRSIERMKETLTGLLLHDVKNPLTVAMMSLNVLERVPLSDPQLVLARHDGQVALARARRMLLDVLDITRLESGAMPLARTRVDLGALVRASTEANHTIGEAHQATTVIEVTRDPVVCELDSKVIRRAVDNLLDNAYRHSRPGQRVLVRVTRDAARAYVEIADQGPGIPAAIRERVFDKFVRADPDNGGGENQGLGLTLVKLAAAAHGGEVNAVCPPSGGTVFRITLPLAGDLPPLGVSV